MKAHPVLIFIWLNQQYCQFKSMADTTRATEGHVPPNDSQHFLHNAYYTKNGKTMSEIRLISLYHCFNSKYLGFRFWRSSYQVPDSNSNKISLLNYPFLTWMWAFFITITILLLISNLCFKYAPKCLDHIHIPFMMKGKFVEGEPKFSWRFLYKFT